MASNPVSVLPARSHNAAGRCAVVDTGVRETVLCAPRQVGCKVLAFVSSYALASNSFWMLCEGIYLHTLIIVAVFAEEQQLRWYFILGWSESLCTCRLDYRPDDLLLSVVLSDEWGETDNWPLSWFQMP